MRLTAMFLGAAMLLPGFAASVAAQQTTGLEAWDILTGFKGAAIGSRVVALLGERGAEQPAVWRVVAKDPSFAGQFREYEVKGGRVISENAVPPAESAAYVTTPLVRGKIKIDSPVVFWRAHTEGRKALIGFDAVDYELRNAEFSSTPVWVVRLRTKNGTMVGELAVSAVSGQVLRRSWYEAGRQTARKTQTRTSPAPGSPATAAINESAQQAWGGTRKGWNQGKKAVKTGFSKASTAVGGWLLKAGQATAPASSEPPSGRKPATASSPAPQSPGPATWERGRYDSGAQR